MSKLLQQMMGIALVLLSLAGCSAPDATPTATAIPTPLPPTATATPIPLPPTATSPPTPLSTSTSTLVYGLSDEDIATLGSLEKVGDFPLYTMHYYGVYERTASSAGAVARMRSDAPPWACSLFAALGDADNPLYGRNFDWEYSPALLLFTHPPDGYASVSMVDIGYMLDPAVALALTDLPLVERKPLLELPYWPFDGMNEHGLVVGMAAVSGTDMPFDPDKETLDSLDIIREMLDHARDVGEALDIMQSYNVSMGGGPPIHYLIADSSGRAALVEFYRGDMVILPNQASWHLATNFLRAQADESGSFTCSRYDRISQALTQAEGQVNTQDAMDLLSQVAQSHTQWSVVYEMSSGDVNVVMGREYDDVHTFNMDID